MPKGSDQTYLLKEQYRNASNLNARIQLHVRFGTNDYPWYHWVFDHLKAPSHAHILEIGCGPASFWKENLDRVPTGWNITLTDLSPGMLDEARKTLEGHTDRFSFEQADAQLLRFNNAQFDLVMANHMLYHVPDRQKAYREIRRIIKPGGIFYAALNGQKHLHELRTLMQRINPDSVSEVQAADYLTLENGIGELAEYFSNISIHRYESPLIVTEVEPLVAYVRSSKRLNSDEMDEFEKIATEAMATHGEIRIVSMPGLFEAHRTSKVESS